MRLIDADEMLLFENVAFMSAQPNCDRLTQKLNEFVHMKIQRLIMDAETAYDVDKVVKELLDSANVMAEQKEPYRYYKAIGTKKAIEIVKRGGIDAGTGDFIQNRN